MHVCAWVCMCEHECGYMLMGTHMLNHEIEVKGQLVGVSVSCLLLPCGNELGSPGLVFSRKFLYWMGRQDSSPSKF
jgi:hypothetical protein